LFGGTNGEPDYLALQKRAKVACEEVQAALVCLWPGQTGAEKVARNLVLEGLYGTRSWTPIEGLPPERLEDALDVLRAFEAAYTATGEQAPSREAVAALLQTCRDQLAQQAQAAQVAAVSAAAEAVF